MPASSPATSRSVDVLVVGGGPAGLAAALAAARRGRSVALVEAAPTLGGLAASFEVAGQRVDLGSHRLHPSAPPAVRELLDELLGDDLQVRTRDGRLHLAGRWVRFPLQASDLVRSVRPGVGARIGRDLVTGRWRHARDGSYAEYVRAGLGPTALARFHGPMARKLWGIDPALLSGELARRRIAVNGGGALAGRIARTSRPRGRTFLYPRLGYGEVADRLAGAAVAAGVGVATATAVTALAPGAPATVRTSDGSGFEAVRVIWTAPLHALAAAVVGAPPVAVRHRGLVLVYLVVEEDRYSPVDAYYVPDADVAFARLSEPKNYRDGPDPVGSTVLCAEVPAAAGDQRWSASDADLGAVVLDGMARVGLRRPDVAEVAVRRLPAVYPLVELGEEADRRRALAWADALPGVTVLGRQGLVVADNVHHVLDMALAAAGCLDAGTAVPGWDEQRWRDERRRFDSFVVDD
jgi:protoporphyrinogen oxidase